MLTNWQYNFINTITYLVKNIIAGHLLQGNFFENESMFPKILNDLTKSALQTFSRPLHNGTLTTKKDFRKLQ